MSIYRYTVFFLPILKAGLERAAEPVKAGLCSTTTTPNITAAGTKQEVHDFEKHSFSTVFALDLMFIYHFWEKTISIFIRCSHLGQLMRLWHFSSSVNSFFKRACASIQLGKLSNFWSDTSSTSILQVCEQRRLWRDCTEAQARLRLPWSPMW